MSPFRSESKEPLACASRRPHVLSSATKCAAELEEKRLSAFEPKARRTLHLFSSKSGVLKEKRFSTFEPKKWRTLHWLAQKWRPVPYVSRRRAGHMRARTPALASSFDGTFSVELGPICRPITAFWFLACAVFLPFLSLFACTLGIDIPCIFVRIHLCISLLGPY